MLRLVPDVVRARLFRGPTPPPPVGNGAWGEGEGGARGWESQVRVFEEGVLAAFADPYANRHLAFRAVELLVVRLVPEMGLRGPGELLEERIGGLGR